MSVDTEITQITDELRIIQRILKMLTGILMNKISYDESTFESILEVYLRVKIIGRRYGFDFPTPHSIGQTIEAICLTLATHRDTIAALQNQLDDKLAVLVAERSLREVFGRLSAELAEADEHYENEFVILTETQRNKLFSKISDIREAVLVAEWIDDPQRTRVLNRLAKVEAELLQPFNSYERGLGGLVNLGDALGEMGRRAKPLVDRVVDIIDSYKGTKKENAQISKDKDPLRIPDLRG